MGTLTTYDHVPAVCHQANNSQNKTLDQMREVMKELDECSRPRKGSVGCGIGQRYSKWVSPLIVYPDQRMTNSRFGSYEKSDHRPPWELPRFPSRELIAGQLKTFCECTRRNGMAVDNCKRLWCRGRPACTAHPEPLCPPSGLWKRWVNPEEAADIMRRIDEVERHWKQDQCQESKTCQRSCQGCGGPLTSDVLKGITSTHNPTQQPKQCEHFILFHQN